MNKINVNRNPQELSSHPVHQLLHGSHLEKWTLLRAATTKEILLSLHIECNFFFRSLCPANRKDAPFYRWNCHVSYEVKIDLERFLAGGLFLSTHAPFFCNMYTNRNIFRAEIRAIFKTSYKIHCFVFEVILRSQSFYFKVDS